jgi:lactate dehydrogenase-like 2-hydroxyacid dehydrogenase
VATIDQDGDHLPRVNVTGAIPERVLAALTADFDVVDTPVGTDGILSVLPTKVDDAFLARAGPRLRIVANYGVGVDNIDLDAARARGIVVANTPDVLTGATAEQAIALMLALLRRVVEGDRMLRRGGEWRFSVEFMLGESLDGKVVAIVGAGRIGRETARLAEAFGATALFVGRGDSLEHALRRADVVSLHVPATPATRHLIDAAALEVMKPSAVLVNTARGSVVDEAALVRALQSGQIAGAALDVFELEPTVSPELLELENVVLTPHLGSATRETREAMGLLAASALRSLLIEGVAPRNVVP